MTIKAFLFLNTKMASIRFYAIFVAGEKVKHIILITLDVRFLQLKKGIFVTSFNLLKKTRAF